LDVDGTEDPRGVRMTEKTYILNFLCRECQGKVHLSTRGHGREQTIICPHCGKNVGMVDARDVRVYS